MFSSIFDKSTSEGFVFNFNDPTAETYASIVIGDKNCLAMAPATTLDAVSRAELLPPPR